MSEYPFDVDDKELLHAIGRVNVNFQILEDLLSSWIAFLLSDRLRSQAPHGYMVACELSYRAKLAVLSSLYQECMGVSLKQKDFVSLLDSMGEFDKRRNKFLHLFWNRTYDGSIERRKPKSHILEGFIHSPSQADPKQLNDFADQMEAKGLILYRELKDNIDAIRDERDAIKGSNVPSTDPPPKNPM
jgi:hypothetical protein